MESLEDQANLGCQVEAGPSDGADTSETMSLAAAHPAEARMRFTGADDPSGAEMRSPVADVPYISDPEIDKPCANI